MTLTLRTRAGMTLIEVVVALMLLGGVLLSLGAFTGRMTRTGALARITETGVQLVADRMDSVRAAPRYVALESLYVKTENTVSGYPQYKRQTKIIHIGGQPADTIDYRVVTVQVTHPQLSSPIRKTLFIAPF
jgi:prepilin-type N-terminal cleavage/methylation domain-containing protein